MKQNKYKILLVEDEDNIRNLVATMLEPAGYQTILAKSCTSGGNSRNASPRRVSCAMLLSHPFLE